MGINLQKMKDIMGKKIVFNDYIYDVVSNEREIERIKDKLGKIGETMERRVHQTKKIMEEEMIEMQCEEHSLNLEVLETPFSIEEIENVNILRQNVH